MNLVEIVQECNSAMDYNPDLASYKTQLVRIINRHYLEVSGQYHWLFLQKDKQVDLYAPVSGASTPIAPDGANGRKINGTGTSFQAGMNGHKIRIGTETFDIIRVESATVLYINNQYSGASTTDWEITFIDYDMPYDVGEVMGFIDKEKLRGRLTFLDARKEEQLFLDETYSGDPLFAIERPAEYTNAPNFGPTAAVSAGGSLNADHTYEYFFTILEKGRESPPSKTVEVTTTSANQTVSLTGMQSLNTPGGLYTGRQRRLYRRDQTLGGRFLLIDTASSGTTYTDTGTFTENDYEARYWDEQGMSQRIRFWFTPKSDMTIHIRYQAIPKRMEGESDQPEWPKQYHQLLVYRALQDVGMQNGATQFASVYEKRAIEVFERMKARWLTRTDRNYIKQGFDRGLYSNFRDNLRYGIPSKI